MLKYMLNTIYCSKSMFCPPPSGKEALDMCLNPAKGINVGLSYIWHFITTTVCPFLLLHLLAVKS